MAAIGMFSGYCGTLMTPMAANFNIVPAALLELPDKNAVIKVQVPTALTLAGRQYLPVEFPDVFIGLLPLVLSSTDASQDRSAIRR